MENKICNKCKEEKSIDSFSSHKTCRGGINKTCNECVNKRRALYREKNRELLKNKNKEYKNKNKEIIKEKKKFVYIRDKDKIRKRTEKWRKNKMLVDPLFKLKYNIKSLIKISIKRNGFKKKNRTTEILGCSTNQFKLHLESKFEPWMNWDNYGKYNGELNFGWDIDHIIPLSSAKTEEELIKLNHYTNLQPLCSKTNREIKRNNF